MEQFDLSPSRGNEGSGGLWIHRVDLRDPENYRKYLIFKERAERMERYLQNLFFGSSNTDSSAHYAPVDEEEGQQQNVPLWLRPLMLLLQLLLMQNRELLQRQACHAMVCPSGQRPPVSWGGLFEDPGAYVHNMGGRGGQNSALGIPGAENEFNLGGIGNKNTAIGATDSSNLFNMGGAFNRALGSDENDLFNIGGENNQQRTKGGAGDDVFRIGGSNNRVSIRGGSGYDTLMLQGSPDDWSMLHHEGKTYMENNRTGNRVLAESIESFRFSEESEAEQEELPLPQPAGIQTA
jgi:hypothetical protein